MKRTVNVLLVAGLALGLSGCGTSKEEEACREHGSSFRGGGSGSGK